MNAVSECQLPQVLHTHSPIHVQMPWRNGVVVAESAQKAAVATADRITINIPRRRMGAPAYTYPIYMWDVLRTGFYGMRDKDKKKQNTIWHTTVDEWCTVYKANSIIWL